MLVEQNEGHIVNVSSGNGGFTPMAATAIYPVTKAAVVTLTECLWGQLRELGSQVSASVLFPSTATPGVLATGIWRAGAHRPERYSRNDPDDGVARDALKDYIERAKEAGEEVPIAPLSEVADFEYKCTEYYHPEDESGVRWDDTEIGVEWPIRNPILSRKDRELPSLAKLWDL